MRTEDRPAPSPGGTEEAPGRAADGPRRPERSGRLASLLLTLGGAAAVLGVLLLAGILFPGLTARHLAPIFLYLPGPRAVEESDPASHGLSHGEEIRITTSDGLRLHGWWIPAADPPRDAGADGPPAGEVGAVEGIAAADPLARACGTVLFLHGNAGALQSRAFVARRFSAEGFHTLLVDYRGYGRSEGEPDEEGLYRDARAARAHATGARGTPPTRLAVVGNSLGSPVAAHLASRSTVGALVLTGAFTSIPDLGSAVHPWLPDAFFRGWPTHRFETIRWIRGVEAPTLVARGERDALVPREQTRRVHQAAGPGAEWLEVADAGHNDLWAAPGLWGRLVPFLEEALGCTGASSARPPSARPPSESGRGALPVRQGERTRRSRP